MYEQSDFFRTLRLLSDLIGYSHGRDVDRAFLKAVGPSLAASLPAGTFPPGYDPTSGPRYPRSEW
ncbi:hypothetical protein EOT10_08435 [Streptomyces antnestii]|uniref:Uncharacterized protein n=1 Tax=Streptomyces antnestii TaxID=2494256 RepID=A0A3S2Z2H6_9ACTN|nr:hypothetical protein [Streptomyces sp. San01]RVU27194.1 hypothetical protein EOT10_08435 [Streptomyces sp. San01]